MTVGILELALRINSSQSLKEKRMVLKSLKDRLRNSFNIAVSETDEQDKWQLARLCVVTVNSDKKYVNSLVSKVVEFIQRFPQIELLDYQIELI